MLLVSWMIFLVVFTSDWVMNWVEGTFRMVFLRFSARTNQCKKLIADSHLFICISKTRVVKVKFISLTDFLFLPGLLVRHLC